MVAQLFYSRLHNYLSQNLLANLNWASEREKKIEIIQPVDQVSSEYDPDRFWCSLPISPVMKETEMK